MEQNIEAGGKIKKKQRVNNFSFNVQGATPGDLSPGVFM